MSQYGRRALNMSYLQGLNTVDNDANTDGTFSIENNLALFTNTEFFDIDAGHSTDFQAKPTKADVEASHHASPSDDVSAPSVMASELDLDHFMQGGDFNFHDMNAFPPAPSINNFVDGNQGYQQIQPGHGPVYGGQIPPQHVPYPREASRPADKRKADAPQQASRPASMEEASRNAAEEDKRRRNTAASARFRVKKKQREQALEKSAKEMTEKVTALENKVNQLETENKWLKSLLVEKNDGNKDIITQLKEFAKQAVKTKTKTSTASAESDQAKAEEEP
ncbi:regulatory protein cys-3 [Stachybotrys elegans]|uniref:Regulatory protein cys-3 n=1 Tax=Stachybotrys elegans TaxID=80388 RepID=A0A8K0SY17_9HYPO|nr:regulatory protein cys-3 [Stachybotrys elegans]